MRPCMNVVSGFYTGSVPIYYSGGELSINIILTIEIGDSAIKDFSTIQDKFHLFVLGHCVTLPVQQVLSYNH